MTMSQKIIGPLGIFYLAIGVLGFVPGITMTTSMPGQGMLLGIFAVNALHNVAHILLGAVMIWAGMSVARVEMTAKAMTAVFALLVVASFIAPLAEGVAINLPDTLLHLVSFLLVGYVGFMAERGETPAVT